MMTLRYPVPGKPWSANDVPGSVRAKIGQSRLKQAWRDAATVYARQATARDPRGRRQPASNVQVVIPFGTNRRRDPHNYVGTVVKATIDGLVNAGLWPDDSPEFITVLEPVLVVGDWVEIRITPRTVRKT